MMCRKALEMKFPEKVLADKIKDNCEKNGKKKYTKNGKEHFFSKKEQMILLHDDIRLFFNTA